MSDADQMLLELEGLLPEKEEAQEPKTSKRKAVKSEPTSIEVPPVEIVSVEVIPPAEPAPVLSPQTMLEMEAGAKALQNYR